MGAREIGLQARCALHRFDGPRQFACHRQRIAERIQRLGGIRTHRERGPIMPKGSVPLSLGR